MSSATKILLPLLLLAGVAGGALYFVNRGGDAPLDVPSTAPPDRPTEQPKPAVPEPAIADPVRPPPIREVVTRTEGNANADAEQGVLGRVLEPNGNPAAGVEVFLMESTLNDPITVFLRNKEGIRSAPAASMTTGADGTFKLGTRKAGKQYDVRVVSPSHPELQYPLVRVSEGEWADVHDLKLERGAVVRGRVVQETVMAPIANANVYLASTSSAHEMVATPGRERGIVAVTDGGGFFRFDNAPRTGLVNLSAEAQGYSYTEKANLQLNPDGNNEFTLELATGMPIAGVVVDADGKPVGNARIQATALSAKMPQTASAVSQSDGSFSFAALRDGPYQLQVSARQYDDKVEKPVMAGATDVKLVLDARAWAKVRVLAQNGAPVKAYRLSLKRHFPNNSLGIGNVPEFADLNVTPGDYPPEHGGDWAVVRGLVPGEFVFQITERNHAKTLSPPFTVAPGAQPPEVEVRLTLGATIQGTVLDDRGTPVAGATVTTDMNSAFAMGEDGIGDLFKSFMPEKHTRSQATTDGQGRFRIGKLAFAEYMIRVVHPEFCEEPSMDIKLVEEGQVVDVGVLHLSRGATITGVTTVGGLPAGQVKISVTTPAENVAPVQDGGFQPAPATPSPKKLFMASAVSDGNGKYTLLKRVPPGTYKIHAFVEGGSNNPFSRLLQMKQTERTLTVGMGQDTLVQNFDIPPQ